MRKPLKISELLCRQWVLSTGVCDGGTAQTARRCLRFIVLFVSTLKAKTREYVLPAWFVCLFVCVCLFVTTITKKIVDGLVPNFTGRKRKTKFVQSQV